MSSYIYSRWLYRPWMRVLHYFGFHAYRGYRDCGDGIHIQPNVPLSKADWMKCDWCGARR